MDYQTINESQQSSFIQNYQTTNEPQQHQFIQTAKDAATRQIEEGIVTVISIISCIVLVRLSKMLEEIKQGISDKLKGVNRPKLSIKQEDEIKQCLRFFVQKTAFDRASLFFIDDPKIENDQTLASSYSLWIQATSGVPCPDVKFPFPYVSPEYNKITNEQKFTSYNNIADGNVCIVWLKARKTRAYCFYKVPSFGFLLLEKTDNNLITIIKKKITKNNKNYLESCKVIESILSDVTVVKSKQRFLFFGNK